MAKKNKIIVGVAWSHEASDLLVELNENWDKFKKVAKKDLSYSEVEFSTLAEAEAYRKGIEDCVGWDEPHHVILKRITPSLAFIKT